MLGDNMAILSGGMYGNPESEFTNATPSAGFNWGKAASTAGGLLSVGSTMVGMIGAEAQANRNIQSLKDEKRTNVELFQQNIADKMAADKISFFSSGLDYTKGTASSVIKNNSDVLSKELVGMEKQYDTAIANEKSKRNAAIVSGIFDIGSKALSMAG